MINPGTGRVQQVLISAYLSAGDCLVVSGFAGLAVAQYPLADAQRPGSSKPSFSECTSCVDSGATLSMRPLQNQFQESGHLDFCTSKSTLGRFEILRPVEGARPRERYSLGFVGCTC